MPVRPASLATMSAAIAGAVRQDTDGAGATGTPRATLTFDSGHQQHIEGTGCHQVTEGSGRLVALSTDSDTTFVLFTGPHCQGSRILDTGQGTVEYSTPTAVGSVVLG
ncbi:hypothetical protein RIF23_07305 [Lipingzhangella sp. LS1_29]|uniref:Uncharacterized protein n=1 Tax=Lipingzhangella rawalii TaxID=2055835 RepID=A0ABU2H474_9ACTN|nr:hypothetical protein [Lipingzhangella rawalii]MDS1270098.1 hypothetical protein [Lipingzhangella rawalii]